MAAASHYHILWALPHAALGLIPCQFRTAHIFGQNRSFQIMESTVQDCSGHWSFLNRQRISAGISWMRSLSVEAANANVFELLVCDNRLPSAKLKIGRSQSPCGSGY